MSNRVGTHIKQDISGESFYSYISAPLPPIPKIDIARIDKHLQVEEVIKRR